MSHFRSPGRLLLTGLLLALGAAFPAAAGVLVQCPGDLNGDAVPDHYYKVISGVKTPVPVGTPGAIVNPAWKPNVRCMHISCGDGYQTMGDGASIYTFGFSDLTGTPPAAALQTAFLEANWPAPSIVLDEGDEFYLTLTNVNFALRPDLFDPHTVHFHGFPQASSVFDGMPEGSIGILGGNSLTYYYKIVIPGTYMYHCHQEAAEHMQQGMLGNLYVRPAQDKLASQTLPGGFPHVQGSLYAYNDGDGSTKADVEIPIQLGSFDAWFHNTEQGIQGADFTLEDPKYAQLNGRGYPDTVNPDPLPITPAEDNFQNPWPGVLPTKTTQNVSSRITAASGQKILLRFSSLDTTKFFTVTALGLPWKVVGLDGRLLDRCTQVAGVECLNGSTVSPSVVAAPKNYYKTSSITLGGGMSADVLIDTTGLSGTFFLYTTNLNYLSNAAQDYGGMMTEIVIQ